MVGVLVVGKSKSRVENPREGRRANAMLIVELIVTSLTERELSRLRDP